MERRIVVEALRYDVSHKWRKHRVKIRELLEAESLEEIGDKLTPNEIKHVFGEADIYPPRNRFGKDAEVQLLVSCKTCGRYMKLSWYYEGVPDILQLWRHLIKGKKLYCVKEHIMDCMIRLHEIEIRPHSDLVEVRALRHIISQSEETKKAEKLLCTILGEGVDDGSSEM